MEMIETSFMSPRDVKWVSALGLNSSEMAVVDVDTISRRPTPPGNWSLRSWKVRENIHENYALRHFCGEFWRLKLHQISNFPGLCPRPHWGSLQCSTGPPSWWEGARYATPSPRTPSPLSGLGLLLSLYLSICGLQKGPGKFLMGVLESRGKVLDFFCQ